MLKKNWMFFSKKKTQLWFRNNLRTSNWLAPGPYQYNIIPVKMYSPAFSLHALWKLSAELSQSRVSNVVILIVGRIFGLQTSEQTLCLTSSIKRKNKNRSSIKSDFFGLALRYYYPYRTCIMSDECYYYVCHNYRRSCYCCE